MPGTQRDKWFFRAQSDGEAAFMVLSALIPLCALCLALFLPNCHLSAWGKVGLCRWLCSPGLWLESGRVLELLYAIPAGGSTSSLQGWAGALTLAKGEAREQAGVKVSSTSSDARGKCITGSGELDPC